MSEYWPGYEYPGYPASPITTSWSWRSSSWKLTLKQKKSLQEMGEPREHPFLYSDLWQCSSHIFNCQNFFSCKSIIPSGFQWEQCFVLQYWRKVPLAEFPASPERIHVTGRVDPHLGKVEISLDFILENCHYWDSFVLYSSYSFDDRSHLTQVTWVCQALIPPTLASLRLVWRTVCWGEDLIARSLQYQLLEVILCA